MMKTTQKLIPLLLSLVLLLSLSPAALAEEPEQPSIIAEDALNQWMDEYVKAHNLQNDWQEFSVGFCYTATGDCWYYNGDVFLYSASMYKVPVAMLLAEKEAAGELTQESLLLGYSLQYLESSALTYSNNDSGHAMVDYLGGTYQGKCSDMCIRYSSLPEDYFVQDFYDLSYYSARFITQVMATLYEGGEERFPHVLEHLLVAQPDSYLNLSLGGKYKVAQKYGAFTERNGNNNNHITAIVYTPTPIVVTVMTRNVGDYQARMAEIGAYLADYSLELDEKLAERERQAQEEAAAEQRPGLIPAPPAEVGPEDVPGTPAGEAAQTPDAPLPQQQTDAPDAQTDGEKAPLLPAFLVMCAAALLIALILYRNARRQPRRKRRVTAVGSSANGASRQPRQ